MLNVAIVPDTTVIIYHRQFAYPESFIVQVSWDIIYFTKTLYHNNIFFLLWQYYKLLFNYNVR